MNTTKSNTKRNAIQKEAGDIWRKTGSEGLLAMATGSGKSKIVVDEVKERSRKGAFKALLVVPTEKLRDNTWPDEFKKWKGLTAWKNVRRECYASLAKIKKERFDLVILDECHHITPANSVFFRNNKYESLLALTATPPEDPEKQLILNKLAPIVYTYTLEQGVKDGLVAPFEIIVVEHKLNNTRRNIKSGTKAKPFMQTEQAKYDYLTKNISRLMYSKAPEKAKQFAYLNRMHFIYNLPSKLSVAQRVLKKYIKGRHLVFCANIAQAETLCAPNTFHSNRNSKAYDDFVAEKIDNCGVVRAVNEGHNIPNLDMALVVQLNSKELDIVQRIGRIVRFRPGHKAKIYIIVAEGTKDQDWLAKSLASFDESLITFKKDYQL